MREQVDRRDMSDCRARPVLEAAAGITRAETLCLGANHPHHVRPVGVGGPRLDPDNVITVCARMHGWIHDNPKRAEWLGLLVPSGPPDMILQAVELRKARERGGEDDQQDPPWW